MPIPINKFEFKMLNALKLETEAIFIHNSKKIIKGEEADEEWYKTQCRFAVS